MTGTQAQSDATTQAAQRGRIEPGAVAASALAFGALSLPDPNQLTSARRRLLRLGRAAFLGWYTWDLTRRTPVTAHPGAWRSKLRFCTTSRRYGATTPAHHEPIWNAAYNRLSSGMAMEGIILCRNYD